MTTTLITGANKGIGFGTARCLMEAGHTVYVGAPSTPRGVGVIGLFGPVSVVRAEQPTYRPGIAAVSAGIPLGVCVI